MKVIVVGSGRVGAALAQDLCRRNQSVAVIDPDPGAFSRLGPDFQGRMIHGLGFDRDALLRAGIEQCDALAACTSNDNANMVVARIARDVFRVPIVIARLYDPARRPLYHNLDVQVVCTTLWGAEQMVSLITHPQWQVVGTLGNGEVQVVQIRVGRALAGRTVGFLSEDRALVVVGFTRGSQTCIAQPDQVLEQGDLVYLGLDVTANESVLHQLVGNGREVAA